VANRPRFYDTEASPSNLRAIWDRLHDLSSKHEANATTITQQAATIASLQSQLTAAQQQAQQALITAGKAVSQTSQALPPAGGGGSPPAGGDTHPNHYALIKQAKDELVALSTDLSGPCGAFKIVQRAVPYIQASDPAAGFLSKTSGNNCGGFAVDIVCYNDGVIYDVLIDAGASNGPSWSFSGTVDPGRYRATA
jgi:Tfp pilus assembly protein FimV